MFTTIIKRDGRTAAYDVEKIANAIFRAATSVGGKDYQTAYHLALQVGQRLEEKYAPSQSLTVSPTVEQIQDMVEKVLIENGASVVGGCCGTTPEFIREISRSLGR